MNKRLIPFVVFASAVVGAQGSAHATGRTVTMPCQSNAPNVKQANTNVNHVYADSCVGKPPGATNGSLILQDTTITPNGDGFPGIETDPDGTTKINSIIIDDKSSIIGDPDGTPAIVNHGEINEIDVNGKVTGDGDSVIENDGHINKIVDEGEIHNTTPNKPDIVNDGTIDEIDNAQGGGDKPALVLEGKVPETYDEIITPNGHGEIIINPTGPDDHQDMKYGISDNSGDPGNAKPGTEKDVITVNEDATHHVDIQDKGTFGDRGIDQLACATNDVTHVKTCDVKISGLYTDFIGFNNPNVPNTYAVVASNRNAVEGLMHQRYAVLNSVMQYDCKKFDVHGFCISFQARSTGFGTQATGAGVLNASYRVTDQVRIGAYLDYQVAAGNPYSTTAITGGVQAGYDNPTFGGYVGYSGGGYGSSPGYTGLQLKVSGGYNPGKVSVTRGLLYATEPATGTAGLNSYYVYGSAGYGVAINDKMVVEPYMGLGYTDVSRSSYAESFNLATTLFPLAYNAYYERLLTGYAGAHMRGMLTDAFGYQIGVAGQFDLNRSANGYTGWSTMPGMGIFGVQHGGAWNGVRPVGNAGVFYDVSKNERLLLNGYTGQQAFSTRSYLTGLMGYQVSF